MSNVGAVRVHREDDPDLARVDDVRDPGVLAVAVGEPVEDVQGHLEAHVLVGVVEAVEQDLGLVLVDVDVVADLRRPQLAALVALADREQVDDVGVGRGDRRGPPPPSRRTCGTPASRPGSPTRRARPAGATAGTTRARAIDGRSTRRRTDRCMRSACRLVSSRGARRWSGVATAIVARRPSGRSRARPGIDWRQRRPARPPSPTHGRRFHREPAMTAERIKITYATLRADNEDAPRRLRGRPREGEGPAGRVPPQLRRRPRARRRRARSSSARRSTATSSSGRSPRAPGQDVQDAIAAARRAQPAWFRLGWEKRLEILKRAAELISERQMEYARPDGHRGRQDPARGPRRGRGGGRPHPLLRQDGRGQRVLRPPDGQPRRRGRPHPVDPAAARRVRGHQPVQLPDGAVRRPVVRRR